MAPVTLARCYGIDVQSRSSRQSFRRTIGINKLLKLHPMELRQRAGGCRCRFCGDRVSVPRYARVAILNQLPSCGIPQSQSIKNNVTDVEVAIQKLTICMKIILTLTGYLAFDSIETNSRKGKSLPAFEFSTHTHNDTEFSQLAKPQTF